MADFLSTLFSALPSILSGLNREADPYRQQQEALAAKQSRYADASANPNDPLYKNLYSQYQQKNSNNLAEVIAEAQRQNRSQSRMGRQPLFSQERGGENLFRSLMQGYQESGAQSDTQTRAALQGAGGLGQQAAQQYAAASPWTAMGSAQQLNSYKTLGDVFNRDQGGGGYGNGAGGYQTIDNRGTQGINWNPSDLADLLKRNEPSYSAWSY